MSDHPKAAQIAGNPKEAEQYIGDLVRENERLRAALTKIVHKAETLTEIHSIAAAALSR